MSAPEVILADQLRAIADDIGDISDKVDEEHQLLLVQAAKRIRLLAENICPLFQEAKP